MHSMRGSGVVEASSCTFMKRETKFLAGSIQLHQIGKNSLAYTWKEGKKWAIYAVQIDDVGRERRQVIVMEGGTYMHRGMSSLEVEVLALEEAMTYLHTYM